MTEIEKLRVLLPHWIEHNNEHAGDYARWADVAAEAGHADAAEMIRSAIERAQEASADLARALAALGGALSPGEHQHAHDHSHGH
jgi:hypothetical protein